MYQSKLTQFLSPLLALFLVAGLVGRATNADAQVIVQEGFSISSDISFWVEWQDLSDTERLERREKLVQWFSTLRNFGDQILVAAPGAPLGSIDVILPDPDKPSLGRTIDLDYTIGILHDAGLSAVLEIRPSSASELTAPESRNKLKGQAKSLAERYDGDTDFGVDPPGAAEPFPHPDINGSWVVSVADWDNTDDAQKEEFAAAHTVTTFTVASGVNIDQPNLDEHADWINDVAKSIREGNPDAKVLVGPWRLSHIKKGNLEALLSVALAESTPPISGIIIDVDLDLSDLGADDLMTRVTNLKPVLSSIGGQDLQLIFSGLHIPAKEHSSELSWIRSCPSGMICNEDTQAQLLIKTAVRLMERGHGVGVAGTVRTEGQEDLPGPLATTAGSWDSGDTPTLTAAGISWIRFLELTQMTSIVPVDQQIQIQNVFSFRLGEEGPEQKLITWYDWYRESPPGQPYGGIEKTATLSVPEGVTALESWLLTGVEPDAPVSVTDDFDWEAVSSEEVDGSDFDLSLQDKVLALSFSETSQPPADTTTSSDTQSGDVTSSSDEGADTSQPSGGGGGCIAAPGSSPSGLWIFTLTLGALYVSRRRTQPLA